VSSDLLALARDPEARDELAACLTLIRHREPLSESMRGEIDALLRQLHGKVSPLMRASIEAELTVRLDGRLTPASFLALTELAITHLPLRALLIRRSDLPEEASGRFWPHLTPAEKAVLLLAAAPYGEDEALRIADKAKLVLHALLRRGELPQSVDTIEARLSEGHASMDGAVARLARQRRIADLAELLARRLSMSVRSCLNLLAMRSSRGSALLCRALGLSYISVKDIARMRRDLGYQMLGAPDAGADTFDETSKETAQALLAVYEAESAKRGM
jgi:Uncharacterised protein conserved in bacteria (DUF2336)